VKKVFRNELKEDGFNLDFLLDLSFKRDLKALKESFDKLMKVLDDNIGIFRINKNVKIQIKHMEDQKHDIFQENVFKFGTRVESKENSILIEFYDNWDEFAPLIILREALYLYIPEYLSSNKIVLLGINAIVEEWLSKFENLDRWKKIIRDNLNFPEIEFDIEIESLTKFMSKEFSKKTLEHVKAFLEHVQKSTSITIDSLDQYYIEYFKKILFEMGITIYSDDLLETLKALIEIFYETKLLGSLSDYEEIFVKLKREGAISTELSSSKFSRLVRWISNFTHIAASYQVDWKTIGCQACVCLLVFNQALSVDKIMEIMEQIPFIVAPKFAYPRSIITFFVLPRTYLKDLKDLLIRMENDGYLVEKKLVSLDSYKLFVNANYLSQKFRDFIIIDPENKDYVDRYEFEFKMNFSKTILDVHFSLFDLLLIDRMRFNSISGFTLKKMGELINAIKMDISNELKYQKNLISNFKETTNKILNSVESTKQLLKLIESNEKKGFFGILKHLEKIIQILNIISENLINGKTIRDINEILKILYEKKDDLQYKDILILKDNNLHKLLKNILPLFFESRNKRKEIIERYSMFFSLMTIMSELKVFDLNSIKNLFLTPSLLKDILSKKEMKIIKELEGIKEKHFSLKVVDDRIKRLLSRNQPVIKPLLINTILPIAMDRNYFSIFLRDNYKVVGILNQIKKYFPVIFYYHATDEFSGKSIIYFEACFGDLGIQEKSELFKTIINIFDKFVVHAGRCFYPGFVPYFSLKRFYDLNSKKFVYTKSLFKEFYKFLILEFGKISNNQKHVPKT